MEERDDAKVEGRCHFRSPRSKSRICQIEGMCYLLGELDAAVDRVGLGWWGIKVRIDLLKNGFDGKDWKSRVSLKRTMMSVIQYLIDSIVELKTN